MKKPVNLALFVGSLILTAIAATTTANAGAVLDRILATKTLTVAVGTNWGKNSFLNEKHELVGYDIDVANGVAKFLNVQAKFVTPGWDLIVGGKWGNRWDLATYMSPRMSRTDKFEFPAYYQYGGTGAAVHKDSKLTKLSDLEGKTVGVTAGTQEEQYLAHKLVPDWLDAKPIEFKFTPGKVNVYENTSLALDDLRLGDGARVDAVMSTTNNLKDAIDHGYPIKLLDAPAFYSPSSLVVEKGDKEFSEKVAAAVEKMREDGSLSQAAVKWFGMDISIEK
ncbi:transporter substrate-binding domain-containing protein [Rhizobium sp. NXC24]|uniref:transporter substrate-binding domain-containing protein n=1 Tax=Rhizobium sp. NXC24 TaxID=2048897 RepID=UPI000CDF4626|nr:transporter substrate-binding domain-containing protein [Rhizobium sp. NXC24]AVA24220.1 ABC transporter substrate-binding protein [Rhizobium sp. NXC24]